MENCLEWQKLWEQLTIMLSVRVVCRCARPLRLDKECGLNLEPAFWESKGDKNVCEPYLYGNETYIVPNFNITTLPVIINHFFPWRRRYIYCNLSCLYKIKYSKRQTHKMNTMKHLQHSQRHNHKWKKKRWKQKWKIIVKTSKLQQ